MVRKRFGLTHQSEALRHQEPSLPDFPTEALQLLEQGRGKRFQLGYPLKRFTRNSLFKGKRFIIRSPEPAKRFVASS